MFIFVIDCIKNNKLIKIMLKNLTSNNTLKLVISTLVTYVTFSCTASKNTDSSFPLNEMMKIEKTIQEPKFKNATYNIVNYGAKPDGITFCTDSFKKAIEECNKNGGGKVIVPFGKYLTGAIHLEDNVNLHLEDGAEIIFSTNPKDYPIVHTSFEGIELMNYSPLIYAYQKKNIAITGKGILNGQGNNENWWPWKGSTSEGNEYGYTKGNPSQQDLENLPRLMDMSEKNVPLEKRIFGDGHYLRPNFIEPFECENVLIKDVKIINAPFWIIHPMKSKNVIVDGVHIASHGPNNDGCDPEYSKNVLIKNSIFNTGDDCIAIKAGRDAEGRRVGITTENIIVRDCKMIDGHGGVVIGSEMSAGVKNVFAYNCYMDSPNLDRAIRLKTNTKRGGFVDGLYVKNITVGQVKEALLHITMKYSVYGNQTGDFIPKIKNIYMENITVKDAGKYVIFADGLENSKIENITLKNIKIDKVKDEFKINNIKNLKITESYIKDKKIITPQN